MRTAHLTIAGMNAVHAVRAVYTAFAGVPGVLHVDVSLGAAILDHDGSVTRAAAAEAIAVAGFELVGWREERRLPTL